MEGVDKYLFNYTEISDIELKVLKKYAPELLVSWRTKVPSERNFVKTLMRELKKIPKSWWYKIPDPVRCPKCGIAGLGSKRPFDIVGCVNGKFVALEAKASGQLKASPHQVANLYLVEAAGGYNAIIAPENKEQVITEICNLEKF